MALSNIKGATEENTCIWKPNQKFYETWDTSCEHFGFFIRDGWHPADDNFHYCPFCGRMIFVTNETLENTSNSNDITDMNNPYSTYRQSLEMQNKDILGN